MPFCCIGQPAMGSGLGFARSSFSSSRSLLSCRWSGLGEVRIINFRIDFDLVDCKRLPVIRARAPLINFEWKLQPLDLAVVGKRALPRQLFVLYLAKTLPFRRQKRRAVDQIRAHLAAFACDLQAVDRLTFRLLFP